MRGKPQPMVRRKPIAKPAPRPNKPALRVNKPEPRENKPEPHVNKPQPRVNKPEQRVNKPEEQAQKEEPKKQEEVKKDVKSPTLSEQQCSGYYELNALMTKMVDAELTDVMTKVSQVLPDAASSETECLIVDTIRNKAAMDLRNVLGLNVSKRLLNVHNPLNVKVKFNGKPEKEELREFLKKYKFTAFARKDVNIFAAQVKSIDDFDKICTDSDVRCGNAKVSISPVYKFTTCPPNLKTNYNDISFEILDTDFTNDEIENVDQAKKANTDTPKENQIKSAKKSTGNNPMKVKVEKQDNIVKDTPTVEVNNTNKTPVKSSETKKSPEVKTPQNTGTTSKPEVKTETKQNTPAKPTPQKPSPAKGTNVPKVTPTITQTQQKKVTPTKGNNVATPQKSTKPAPKKTNAGDDFDELDDHDILALMSGGIVLDECSGSDDE